MPKLIIQLMNEEWSVDLQVGSNVLGRATTCSVPLKDASLSRQHCDIVYIGGAATVVDKGSMNGTLVNGRKVTEHKLQPGDKITIGASTIWFEKKNIAVERPASAPRPPTGEVRRPAAPAAPPAPQAAPSTRRMVAKVAAPPAPPPPSASVPEEDAAQAEALLGDFSFGGRSGGSWGKIVLAAVVLIVLGAGAYLAKGLFTTAPVREEAADSLIQNGSFDGLPPGRPALWQVRAASVLGPADRTSNSITIDPAQGRNGSGCLVLEKAGGGSDLVLEAIYAEQIALGKGSQLRAESWVRADGFAGRILYKVEWLRALNGIILAEEYSDPAVQGSSSWTKMGSTFTPPPGAGAVRFGLAAIGRAGRIYVDDLVVRLEAASSPPKEKKLGDHKVASTREGVVAIALKGGVTISNIGVRLESEKEGTTSQAFATDVQTSEDETSLTFTGRILHPADLRDVEFEGRVESVQGGTTVYYVFKPEALRQIDRVTIAMTVPRDTIQGPERPEDPASRISFTAGEGDVLVEYPRDMAKIRTKKLEGRLRLAQSFAVDSSGGDDLAFGLKIRDASAGSGSADPAREAEEARRKGRLGQALALLQGLVKTIREPKAKDAMESEIRSLEETEQRDWADAQARSFQARLTRRADQVSQAKGTIDRYLETWPGEGREAKANQLRSDLEKDLKGEADTDQDRPKRILERAKKWAELGKRSLAQTMLQTLVAKYPQSEVVAEAQELLRKVGQ